MQTGANPAKEAERTDLPKTPTGIVGFDEITGGGLPRGRPTLVCGGPGCGKTLMAIEFLVRGAEMFGEPGVMMAFEETEEDLAANVRSLGFDLEELVRRERLVIDHVRVERSEIEETGVYDLEGLFVRLDHAVRSIGAKRVVLDTLEVLFAGLSDPGIVRSEIRRLFAWLREKGLTAVVTAERGQGPLTRHGLEEYVSDCVILLDHRVVEQVSTRRLRIVKYRGSSHGANEFPFLIDDDGITVVPITSAGMDHPASTERVSSGLASLDAMLGGKGFFRGSSVLVSGAPGTGKTSLASQFAVAACARGEKCLCFSFEESPAQLERNLASIGLDLGQWIRNGRLVIKAVRPTRYGLEMHLTKMIKDIAELDPQVVVVDPISNFIAAGTLADAGALLVRLVDHLKQRGVSSLFTDLTRGASPEASDLGLSSIIDTWVCLGSGEREGERSGTIYVLKSRGMSHSQRVMGFHLTDTGIRIDDRLPGAPRSAGAAPGGNENR